MSSADPSLTGERVRTSRLDSTEEVTRRERKRQSDRHAQRKVREKTKRRIEELEGALEALLSTDANRKLKEKIRENSALKMENAQLRLRLDCISKISGGSAEGNMLHGTANEVDQQPRGSNLTHQNCTAPQAEHPSSPASAQSCNSNDLRPALVTTYGDMWAAEIFESDASRTAYLQGDFEPAPQALWNQLIPSIEESWPPVGSDSEVNLWSTPEVSSAMKHLTQRPANHSSGEERSLGTMAPLAGYSDLIEEWPLSLELANNQGAMQSPIIAGSSSAPGQALIQPSTRLLPASITPFSGFDRHGIRSPRRSPASYLRSSRKLSEQNSRINQVHFPLNSQPSMVLSMPGYFACWIRKAVEQCSKLSKREVDRLLPTTPCIAAYFGLQTCGSSLSNDLVKILKECSTPLEPTAVLGAYFSLHNFLRYLLLPSQESLSHTPALMHPSQKERAVGHVYDWFNFLPWAHVREGIMSNPDLQNDIDLQNTLTTNIYLNWPYELKDAINFNNPQAAQSSGGDPPACLKDGLDGCGCAGPQLTKRFMECIVRTENWRIRNRAGCINRFPKLKALFS